MKIKINLKNAIMLMFAVGGLFVTVVSCDDSRRKGNCDEDKVSAANDDDSHNNGQNCMSCHVSGGKGEGCFNAAGSVYDSLQQNPHTGGYITLYTGPNGTGTIAAKIPVDKNGNFYTTNQINFGTGLYPAATSANGKTKYMGTSIPSGQCNSCHGVSTGKIWVAN